jgi:hypothetical protein
MDPKRFACSAALVAAITALALATASASAAHETRLRWITLTPGTSSSARTVGPYSHASHNLTMYAYFGRVTNTRLYLDKIIFKYATVDRRCIFGGRAYIWNSSLQLTLNADRSRTYCRMSSYTLQVDRTFYRGQSNGKASVSVQKNSADAYWDASQSHRSNVVFYVP